MPRLSTRKEGLADENTGPADRAARTPRADDAERRLQAVPVPVGRRAVAAAAADSLAARGSAARRGLQGLGDPPHRRRAQPADADLSLLHAVRRRGSGQLSGAL